MMPGFLVEEGRGMEKLVIVAISLNLLTESLLDGRTGNSSDGFVYMLTFIRFFNLMHYIWRTVICLERGAYDLHMVQLMQLSPPIVCCLSIKIWNGFTCLVLAYAGCPVKEAIEKMQMLWSCNCAIVTLRCTLCTAMWYFPCSFLQCIATVQIISTFIKNYNVMHACWTGNWS